MNDNIILKKIWQDNELMQLKVICSSSVVTTSSKIFVSDSLLDELIHQINLFLDGRVEEGLWANEDRGNSTTACVSLRIIKKDKLGHVLVEVFVELDDGGDYTKHNCCFYINTELGLLMNFCNGLSQLKKNVAGFEIQLNEF